MKIGDLAVLAGVVGVGVIIWSKWDEITKGFGAWGIGPDAPIRPPDTPLWVPPSITPYVRPVLPPGYHGPQLPEIMPIPPPSLPELIFPPFALLPDVPQEVPIMPTPPPAPSIPELIFPPLAIIRPIIRSPSPRPTPPTYTPSPPNVWIQPPDMVSDPRRPPGSFGGR